MVVVAPFKGIRPNEELVAKVACLPYDVVDSTEAKEMVSNNPYSYFHIDKAEIDLPADLSPYDPQVYQKAAENLQLFLEKGWLEKEKEDFFYLYELVMEGRSQTGLVACTSIEDYVEGKIKKHEFTRPEKEADRINHIKACDANTSPIFLCYRQQADIQKIMDDWQKQHAPIYDFTSYYEVTHRIWVIDDPKINQSLQEHFEKVEALYIADGHHRSASAVKVGLEKRQQDPANQESERFLSIIFPENELKILEYNRILNIVPPKDFFNQLEKHFTVEKTDTKEAEKAGEFQMYMENTWYTLTIRSESIPDDTVESLDAALLQKYVFDQIFDITDIRTDKRIDFVGGVRGSEELEKLVDAGKGTLAFALYPTAMTDLLKVADEGRNMPPKSTWFEPKLLSGLFLHDLESEKSSD